MRSEKQRRGEPAWHFIPHSALPGGSRVSTVGDVLSVVDRLAPFRLAEDWDNVGLLLGDAGREVRRVLVCLDVREAVCEEAERVGAELVLAHHPLFIKGVQRLTSETRAGRLALRLLRDRRALVAAHTNLDSADGGLCEILADMIALEDLQPLQAAPAAPQYKVVVFVPAESLEAVRAAAFAAGAGGIGAYGECGFSVEGTGTFLPGEGARPAVGEKGRRNEVPERRFETVADARRLGAVLAAVARAHPYEAPAIDVYPLHGPPPGVGLGRIGRFRQPRRLAALADGVRDILGLGAVHYAGEPDRPVERVAVVTGGGGGLCEAVAAAGCDAYLTGELNYHQVEDLAARGIAVILGGHYRTERVPLDAWAVRLAKETDAEVLASESEEEALTLR
jgi:dinuclear metal center YbgI/SA1388 family protein